MKITPTPKTKQGRRAYRYHGPEVWAVARAAYLAGESAASLSERLGLGVPAIGQRITREGWTKRSLVPAQDAAILTAALEEAAKLSRVGRMTEAAGAARAADVVARAAGRLGPRIRQR